MSRAWPRSSAKTVAQKPGDRLSPPLSPLQASPAAAVRADGGDADASRIPNAPSADTRNAWDDHVMGPPPAEAPSQRMMHASGKRCQASLRAPAPVMGKDLSALVVAEIRDQRAQLLLGDERDRLLQADPAGLALMALGPFPALALDPE